MTVARLRADLERIAATSGLVRVVVAHEKVAHGPDAAAVLRQAATCLYHARHANDPPDAHPRARLQQQHQ